MHQVHCRNTFIDTAFGISDNTADIIYVILPRNNRTTRTRLINITGQISDNTTHILIQNNDIHIGFCMGNIHICFTDNAANSLRALDVTLERDIFENSFIIVAFRTLTDNTTHIILPLDKAVRHMHILDGTHLLCRNTRHKVRFRHPARHMDMVKIQIGNGTSQVRDKSHVFLAREPNGQVVNGMVLSVDITPEYNAIGGILVFSDGNESIAAVFVAHLVFRSRSIDILRQDVIRRIEISALAYRLEVFVILNLERARRRAVAFHGAVRCK